MSSSGNKNGKRNSPNEKRSEASKSGEASGVSSAQLNDIKVIFKSAVSKAVNETASPEVKEKIRKDKILAPTPKVKTPRVPSPVVEERRFVPPPHVVEGFMKIGLHYIEADKAATASIMAEEPSMHQSTDSDDETDSSGEDLLPEPSPTKDYTEVPYAYDCRRCKPRAIPQTEFEFKTTVNKYIATVYDEDVGLLQKGLRHDQPCSYMPHPNVFVDELFCEEEGKYPIIDPLKWLESPNFPQMENLLMRSFPGKGCNCRNGFDLCLCCKYFHCLVCAISHFLNVFFGEIMERLRNYVNCLEEVQKKKLFENKPDLLCHGCYLPMNGHESHTEFERFTKCALSEELVRNKGKLQRSEDHFNQMMYNIAMDFGKALDNWIPDRELRQEGKMMIYVKEVLDCLKFVIYICTTYYGLAEASLSFTNLIFMKPSFQHEEGTAHPINTVLSIKRVHFLLQHSVFNILPSLINEYGAVMTMEHQAARGKQIKEYGAQFFHKRIRRHKAKIEEMAKSIGNLSEDCIKAADDIYKVGFDLTPLEILSNIHRFNNSKHLERYCGSFWSRAALMEVFKMICFSFRPMLAPFCTQSRFNSVSSEFALIENLLVLTYEWINHLYGKLTHVKRLLSSEVEATNSKKLLKKCETAQLLNQINRHCTFCGIEIKDNVPKTCKRCNLARYCQKECFDTYKAHHDFLCTEKGASDVLNLLAGLTDKKCEEIIAANRKIRRGQPFQGPLLSKSTE